MSASEPQGKLAKARWSSAPSWQSAAKLQDFSLCGVVFGLRFWNTACTARGESIKSKPVGQFTKTAIYLFHTPHSAMLCGFLCFGKRDTAGVCGETEYQRLPQASLPQQTKADVLRFCRTAECGKRYGSSVVKFFSYLGRSPACWSKAKNNDGGLHVEL